VLEKAGVIDEDEVKVGVLSKEDSWKLFCVHAFPTGFSKIPCELQGVAELVADECKGLPLALKVIGGSMVGKTTRQEWEFQLNCLWESRELPDQQEEEALFGRLKLSYDNLDKDNPILKECFLGFAAFPEDRMVEMEELIKLWKAQGSLDDPTKKLGDDPTLSAYYVLGLLIGRSMIEVAPREHDFLRFKDSYRYKVHDVMRDLALHILEGQRPITCLYRPGKKLVEFPGDWIRTYEKQPCEVRNLSLMDNVLTTLNGVTFFAPKLEVLLLAGNEKLEAMPRDFLKGIENLKVLDLSNCFRLKSVPKEIGKLTQLTHLYLANCRQVRYLPEVLGKLTQLIHLDLSCCGNLKLPKSIRYLQRLQWLDLTECRHPLPSTMGDLKSLEYLSVASESIYEQRGETQWKLGQAFAFDICKLTTLTKLRISGNPGGREIVGLGEQLLKLVSKLVKLKSFHMYNFHALETLPDAIQSMVHLEEFWVRSCFRITIPSFITLFSKLKVLKLESLSSLYSLPALNTLKVLSTLTINGCRWIEKLPDSFTSSDAFPSLKELDCSSSGLVEFSEVEDGAMPMLQILNLDHTHIKNLPNTLIYLKNLKVVYICEDGFDDLCKKFENSCLSKKFSHF